MIFVIDDDEIMAECIARTVGGEVKVFSNAIEAMHAISDGVMPELIFLDILLDGPDGFALLHELVSYSDTAQIPVVVVSSLDLEKEDLSAYGVVGVLNKASMTPQEIKEYVENSVR